MTFRKESTSLDNYLRLAEGLEELLGRPVDLVIEREIAQPLRDGMRGGGELDVDRLERRMRGVTPYPRSADH